MTFVATLQIGASNAGRYAPAEGRLVPGMVGGASSRYIALAEATTLSQWARSLGWNGQDPLVVVAWSAGAFAVRTWLNRGDDRAIPRLGLLLLDGLHGGSNPGTCAPALMAGVLRFAQDAAADPEARLLINTSSAIVPPYSSTGDCQAYLEGHVPRSPSVQLYSYPGDDKAAHIAQVLEVGPGLMRRVVEPWLVTGVAPGQGVSLVKVSVAVGVAAAIGYAAWVWATR